MYIYVHMCVYMHVFACVCACMQVHVCMHVCIHAPACVFAHIPVIAIMPASKHARVNVTVHKKKKKSLHAEFALDTNPSEYLPFAGLVGAGNSNTCVNNAVGIQHLHHFTELFLQVSLKLFVTHWQRVE